MRLTAAGGLEWVFRASDGAEIVLETEPDTTWLDRALVGIIGILPIEWMM